MNEKENCFDDEFEVFWKTVPIRVGKLATIKAYRKARRIATAQEILDGVERYMRTKPAYADWCHPATFLNQGRWMDERPEQSRPGLLKSTAFECPHEPKCLGRNACHVLQQIAAARAMG